MTPAKRPAKSAKKAAKRAPAKRTSKRAAAAPRGLHLRRNEVWVALDGSNIRHIADTDSGNWANGWPICGARPVTGTFVQTAAKLPVCDNCKTVY